MVLCSGLASEAAEAQLRMITRYDPPEGNSVDEFPQHMLWLGDFSSRLRNHQFERLLCAPHRVAARVH